MTIPAQTGDALERWTLGFLVETVLTRDPWLHRSDIAQATGIPMALSRDHDGEFVSDFVAEWAARHGRPYELILGGPAGGHFTGGAGGERIEVDAEEFVRQVAGRGCASAGLLAVQVAI